MRRCLLGALNGVFAASAEQTVRIATLQCRLTHDHPAPSRRTVQSSSSRVRMP